MFGQCVAPARTLTSTNAQRGKAATLVGAFHVVNQVNLNKGLVRVVHSRQAQVITETRHLSWNIPPMDKYRAAAMRHPEAPIGWPMAMALVGGFTEIADMVGKPSSPS